jgi:pyruvate dehydrogenase E2 component (dihydrolipoamide acetyltransferase)
LITAIAVACTAEPALNAWFDSDSMTRRLHQQVDLGVAVDTADGLFVPTLRNIGERRLDSLREGLARIKQDVLARSIPPQELRGQTITLSNFGSIGGRYAELVVVPPQVAIVGTGRIQPAVLAIDDKPTIRRQLPLSLSFDHRAVTGAEAARFMAAMIDDLEHSRNDREPHDD